MSSEALSQSAFDPPRPSGAPPEFDRPITLENWDWPPFNRWSFQNVRQILPTRVVRRGDGPESALVDVAQGLSSIRFRDAEGREREAGEALESVCSDGFLVLIDGRVVLESYFNGMTTRSLHLSQSVSKSITAALMGAVFQRAGLRLDAPVEHYVPELAGCGYKGALLWHVLDMRSGVKFSEDYYDGDSEEGAFERASLWKPQRPGEPTSAYDFILTLRQARPHGGPFDYRSIETEILGWILERTSGLGLAELLSAELWKKIGAEQDAYFTVDRVGSCMASGGFNATLRDYARFGQLMLEEGCFNGRQVIPAQWVRESMRGDRAAFVETAAYFSMFPRASYSRQWWVLDPDKGIVAALGIFGQMIFIDCSRRMVVVKLASAREPLNQEERILTLSLISAIAREFVGH
jgi:CubicO group peptidase (beta-lactamase class C family)